MKKLTKKRSTKERNPIYGYDYNWSWCMSIPCGGTNIETEKCIRASIDGCYSPGRTRCC